MKKLLIALALSIITFSCLADQDIPKPESSLQPIDQVAAIVNDQVITQSQVDITYKRAVAQMRQQGVQVPDESTMKSQILESLIYQTLQLQIAKRNHITVTNTQVNQTIAKIAKQHKMTVAQLTKKVKQSGLSSSEYKKEVKKQLILSILQHQALAKDTQVSDDEVTQFINKYKSHEDFATQYHIIDVLVSSPNKAEAMNIAKSLRSGADILQVKGATVDDLGWKPSTDLPDLFLSQVVNMKKNQVAGPLRAGNGFHIIKLVGIRGAKNKLPTRTQAKAILQQKKFQKALKEWVEKLRKSAYVKIVTPQ